MRNIQLEFTCPGCGLEGLTPEVTPAEAMSLVRGELKLRCPACHAILAMRATQENLIAKLQQLLLLETAETLTKEHLKEEIDHLISEVTLEAQNNKRRTQRRK